MTASALFSIGLGWAVMANAVSAVRLHSLRVARSQLLGSAQEQGIPRFPGRDMVVVDKASVSRNGVELSWTVEAWNGEKPSWSTAIVVVNGSEHSLQPCEQINPVQAVRCTAAVPFGLLANHSGSMSWRVATDGNDASQAVDGPSVLLAPSLRPGYDMVSRGAGTGAPAGWRASWVGGFLQARADFDILLQPNETVTTAVVEVSTPGTVAVYAWCGAPDPEATLLSDDIALPGVATNLAQRTLYRALPVPAGCWGAGGSVSLGFRLGLARYGYLGMWCPGLQGTNSSCRALLAEATVVTSGGRSVTVAASGAAGSGAVGTWTGTSSQSAWTFSHLYHGETIDAAAGLQGGVSWMDPRFHAPSAPGWGAVAAWDTTALPLAAYGVTLHDMPPISARIQSPVQPISVIAAPPLDGSAGWWPQGTTSPADRPLTAPGARAYVFDLGQNYAVTVALRIDLGPPGSAARVAAGGLFVAVRHSELLAGQVSGGPQGNASLLLEPQFYPCTPAAPPAAGGRLRSQGQHNCANQTLAIRLTDQPQRWGAVSEADVASLQALPTSTVVAPLLTWQVGRYVQVEGLHNPAAGVQFQPSALPSEAGGTFWVVGRPTHSGVRPVDAAPPPSRPQPRSSPAVALGAAEAGTAVGLVPGHRAPRGARIVAGAEPGVSGYRSGGLLGAIAQTQANVLQSVPMDCANRERRGWGGDMQWTCGYAQQSLEAGQLYGNFMRTLADTQQVGCRWPWQGEPAPGGQVCAPSKLQPVPWVSNVTAGTVGVFEPASHGLPGLDPSWTTMATEIPFQAWIQTGVTDVAVPGYEQAKAMLQYLEGQADPLLRLVRFGVFGDWAPPALLPRPPTELVSSFAHLVALSRGVTLATLVGDTGSAAHWQSHIDSAAPLWHERYWNASRGAYGLWETEEHSAEGGRSRQLVEAGQSTDRWAVTPGRGPRLQAAEAATLLTPQVLGVAVGTLLTNGSGMPAGAPAALRAALQAYGGSWSVGTVGSRFILDALAAIGAHDEAASLVARDAAPGFAFMLENGPGTIWEHWNAGPANASGGESQSHIMYAGGVGLYLRALAGVPVPASARARDAAHITGQAGPAPPSAAALGAAPLPAIVVGPDAGAGRAWFRLTCGAAGTAGGAPCAAGGFSSSRGRHSDEGLGAVAAADWTLSESSESGSGCGGVSGWSSVAVSLPAGRAATVLVPAPVPRASCRGGNGAATTTTTVILRVCERNTTARAAVCQRLATVDLETASGAVQAVRPEASIDVGVDWAVAAADSPVAAMLQGHGVAIIAPRRAVADAVLSLASAHDESDAVRQFFA